MAEQAKITLADGLLQLGREELKPWKSKDVKAIKKTFTRRFAREWWDQVIKWLNENEVGFGDSVTTQSRSLEVNIGVDRQTARRQLGEQTKQVVSLENYLATIVVFKARWPELEVPEPRKVVINAMCETLSFIQSQRQKVAKTSALVTAFDGTANAMCDPLTPDEWELLCAVFRSAEWRDAASITDPATRNHELHQTSLQIVCNLHSSLTDPSQIRGDELVELVRRWLPAWIIFFAAIPYRWRF